jgi:hypothetical protein
MALARHRLRGENRRLRFGGIRVSALRKFVILPYEHIVV